MKLESIIYTVRRAVGLDLSGYHSELVREKVLERWQDLGLESSEQYIAELRNDPRECRRLIEAVGINHSSFFRDPLVFETIAHRVIPAILDFARPDKREVRVWSAGCAGGQEAISVAILLAEALAEDMKNWQICIFGTDVDDQALAQAERGIWPRKSLEFTRLGLVDRYFKGDGGAFRVRDGLHKLVRFSHNDLTSARTLSPPDSIFGAFDLVLCRNVLIYLKPETRGIVCSKLQRSLRPGGFLVLGQVETVEEESRFRLVTVDQECRIYRRPG